VTNPAFYAANKCDKLVRAKLKNIGIVDVDASAQVPVTNSAFYSNCVHGQIEGAWGLKPS